MKMYKEEWTVVINKSKYILNEERANILKKMIQEGKGGTVMFDDFFINIPFIEEFYLSNKVYDKSKMLDSSTRQEISEEERKRVGQKIAEFKKNFFEKHKMPKTELTPEEHNTRRNELLDQAKSA